MATACLIDETNLEMYTLIWLDDSSAFSEQNHQAFRALINRLKMFHDEQSCGEYIRSLSDQNRVILIIRDYADRAWISGIHDLAQIHSIYLYCKKNEPWIKQFPKIKGIVSDIDDLIPRIHSDQARIHESIPLNIFQSNVNEESSTTGLNGEFLHFQLLINVLLRLKVNRADRQQLITLCENEYQGNQSELGILAEFQRTYRSEQSIWWYTRESFLYKILNKALRTQNIDVLFLFRFFIHDIEQQLQVNRCLAPVRVYRSQLISHVELDRLKHSIGHLISMNSFLSTSLHREQALTFLNQVHTLQRVLFEIDADPSTTNVKPFSNITDQSYFPNEEEILFMLGSIFRIVKIDCNADGIWIIRMVLCNTDEDDVQALSEHMKKQYGEGQTSLLAFGKVLTSMGKYNEAERYFLRLFHDLSENDEYIVYCYRELGNVADEKGDYPTSLKWHRKAIDLLSKTPTGDGSLLAESYNSMGCVYDAQGEYRHALEAYKKASSIWKEIYGDEHLNMAVSLNNIACIYAERKQYSKALENYEEVLQIRQKNLPKNHSDLGASHNNLGEIHRCLGQYDLAFEHLNIALQIYQISLPSQHPDQAEVLMNLGLVYQNTNAKEQAVYHYKKASKILRKTFPSTHSNVRKIDELLHTLQSSQ